MPRIIFDAHLEIFWCPLVRVLLGGVHTLLSHVAKVVLLCVYICMCIHMYVYLYIYINMYMRTHT